MVLLLRLQLTSTAGNSAVGQERPLKVTRLDVRLVLRTDISQQ